MLRSSPRDRQKISNMDFNPQNIYVLGILSIFCIKCQLDSFAKSGAVGVDALNKKRNCILIEILKENIEKIRTRFNSVLYQVVLEC